MYSLEVTQIVDNVILRFTDAHDPRFPILLSTITTQLWQHFHHNPQWGIANITSGHDTIVCTAYPKRHICIDHLMVIINECITNTWFSPIVPMDITIPVRYDDGDNNSDIEFVANFLECTVAELITWHTSKPWLVRFLGFVPGFAYLTREKNHGDSYTDFSADSDADPAADPDSDPSMGSIERAISVRAEKIPRKASPKACVPQGSIALAGDYTGIYPSSSPGGWQLIGQTDIVLWDLANDPPAMLRPGMRVRFIQQ